MTLIPLYVLYGDEPRPRIIMTEPEYLHRCISCFSKWVRKTKIIDVPSLDWEAGLITIYNVEKYDKAKINLVD